MTKHGKAAVVVISIEEYQRLRGQPSLVELIRRAPSFDLLEIERAADTGREIEL